MTGLGVGAEVVGFEQQVNAMKENVRKCTKKLTIESILHQSTLTCGVGKSVGPAVGFAYVGAGLGAGGGSWVVGGGVG